MYGSSQNDICVSKRVSNNIIDGSGSGEGSNSMVGLWCGSMAKNQEVSRGATAWPKTGLGGVRQHPKDGQLAMVWRHGRGQVASCGAMTWPKAGWFGYGEAAWPMAGWSAGVRRCGLGLCGWLWCGGMAWGCVAGCGMTAWAKDGWLA